MRLVSTIGRRAAVALLSLVVCGIPFGTQSLVAQTSKSTELSVPAQSVGRSVILDVGAAEQLRVGVKDPVDARLAASVFVHTSGGELVCRDDPDGVSAEFRCQPPGPGKYYVLIQNTSPVAGAFQIAVDPLRGSTPARSEFATVRVFFSTNRQPAATGHFGAGAAGKSTYGYSDISIPRDHRLGELEGPSLIRLELRSDPNRHVHVLSVASEPLDRFWSRVRGRLAVSKSHEALVFVHGFNVTFDDALRRTAQISYDLSFDGAAILFSWPSQGSLSPLAYQRDVRNADLAAQSLVELLERVALENPNGPVHVIAHSMGNRVLSAALQRLGAKSAPPTLRHVAMMAPDIDRELFKQVAPTLAATARRLTLYASNEDIPITVSGAQAGYPRAGRADADIVVTKGVDTIDASAVDTSVFGLFHSYYADNASILSDLFWLIRDKAPTERFGLTPVQASGGVYWKFRPAAR